MTTLQERLRTNRYNCPTFVVDAAADALDAAEAEIARLTADVAALGTQCGNMLRANERLTAERDAAIANFDKINALCKAGAQTVKELREERDELLAKVAGLEGRIAGMLDAQDAAWNEAIEAAELRLGNRGFTLQASMIRQLKRE